MITVSALATDVDTSAQPVSSCPSTTQNGLNSIMARDHDSNMSNDPPVKFSSVDVQACFASHKMWQVTDGVYGCVCC